MHIRFLVTFNKETANNSKEARNHVIEQLHDEHFCCGEARWARGIADWFVVGGRWSGELSRNSWAKDITEQMTVEETKQGVQVWGTSYDGDSAKKATQTELSGRFQDMWDKAAPKEYKSLKYIRDTYNIYGYEDDAMILTQELYDNLLKAYEGSDESECHADLDYEAVSEDMVGRKWLVVVDYHT